MIWRRFRSAASRQAPVREAALDTSAMRSQLVEIWSREHSDAAECSLIVPIYNGARFLSESLPAVLGQAGIVCDILISDDCSEDGSLDAVLEQAKRYTGPHNVRVFRTSQPAVCEHMPLLAAASRFDRIVQAHQDDVSDPGRARALVSALTGDVKLVTSVARFATATGIREPTQEDVESLKDYAEFGALLIDGRHLIKGACYGMHRDLFRCFPPLSWDYLSHGHDILLFIRAHIIGHWEILFSPLLTVGEHPEQGFRQLIDWQDSATMKFDFALRGLAVLKAAETDLRFAHEAGFADKAATAKLEARLEEVRRHFLDALVTNRELAIKRGFRLSWTKRKGRLA